MENAGIFYGHLEYFTVIWYILGLFGIFSLVFGILCQEKSGNPASNQKSFFRIFCRQTISKDSFQWKANTRKL
jgi:hypothetical protein